MNQIISKDHLQCVAAYIAENALFSGVIEADVPPTSKERGLRVDGTVRGVVRLGDESVVHVGASGQVAPKDEQGQTDTVIEADYVLIDGTVSGRVIARKLLELTASARVRGALEYHRGCTVHNLARVRGSINYVGDDGDEHVGEPAARSPQR